MLNKHGQYVLADRAVGPQNNKAVNQLFVDSLEALAARVRKGGVSARMRGSLSGPPTLISTAEIQVIEEDEAGQGDDPFAAFGEWSSEADDRAHASL